MHSVSSEQRIKKLRGSGGYVIASVTDEDQVKGNLGGPDLFLSPIGRLDPSVISKYHCNTCETEFEGSPSINYENPNERVADNLVLVEKGQYACDRCDSAIAEYRTFQKPNEGAEAGNAVPEGQAQAPAQVEQQAPPPPPAPPAQVEQQAPPPPPAPPAQVEQQAPPPPPAPPAQQVEADVQTQGRQEEKIDPLAVFAPAPGAGRQQEAQQQQQEKAGAEQPASVRPIAGMSVFDENGNMAGTVRDVGVAEGRGMALLVQAPDGGDAVIEWGRIGKIGEVVLLKACDDECCAEQPAAAGVAGAQQPASPGCTKCGFANAAGAKFCEMCGSKV